MNILWINHRDPKHPQSGGSETRILELGKRLSKFGCNIELFCERWPGSKRFEVLDGVKINRIGGLISLHALIPLKLKITNRYDIVIDDIAHGVPWFSPIFTKKPVIAQIHHLHQNDVYYELPYFLARSVALAERSIKCFYKNFIAVSKSTKNELVHNYNISKNSISIIQNGVNPCNNVSKNKNSEPTILWIGRVKKYKRVEHILKAYKIVKKTLPTARLLIVGDGDYLPFLKNFSQNIGLHDVTFTGRVSEEEKNNLLGSSWVVVSTSVVEGWGLTISEAASCFTPAIAYDVCGLRDSIKNGETGILVEDGNIKKLTSTLIKVLGNKKIRARMSKNAFNFTKRMSWDESAEKFLKVLESQL